MNESDLFYQARKSGTRFKAAPADLEHVELRDYRAGESAAVLDFVRGKTRVLVMGGFGGLGKTHLMKTLARAGNLDFVNLEDVASIIETASSIGSTGIAERILDARTHILRVPKALAIDEGTMGLLIDGDRGARPEMPEVLQELLQRYEKLIIMGGGDLLTSEEQTQRIADILPKNLDVSTHSIPFRPLNIRQTAELLRRSRLGIYQDQEPDPGDLVDEKKARLMAQRIIPYFRLLRGVLRLGMSLLLEMPKAYDLESDLSMPFMPEDCLMSALRIQSKYLSLRL